MLSSLMILGLDAAPLFLSRGNGDDFSSSLSSSLATVGARFR